MSLIRRMRKQAAIWWARTTKDRFGRWTFASPVEVDCRWDDTAQEFVTAQGEDSISRSLVYVDRVMAPGDRLMRGALDSATPEDPLETDSFEIRRFDQNPNLRATESLLTAYL